PQPQQFSSYAPLVNDLGADEMKGGNNQLYEVRLTLELFRASMRTSFKNFLKVVLIVISLFISA
ncbi:hypothetical protein Q2T49_34105, partial [Pseudomonas aeruginosa]|uniref:hypothetical protein n=1 Tax=Pseudomonas aeruginosa TaxID=287 RepID=UPI00265EE9C9